MREDIEFDAEGVTLRGWFYPAEGVSGPAPCIILTHGFSCTKEMGLEPFADVFSAAGFACVVYDHAGFGASEVAAGKPRLELDPWTQIRDTQHAITYAQGRADVDASRIGLWGSSYSGGNAFVVAAIDRRVKAVSGQVPATYGRRNFETAIPPEFRQGALDGQAADRLARARGEAPAMIPVVTEDPTRPAVMPTPDAWAFFSAYEGTAWRNEVTLRSTELGGFEAAEFFKYVAPTPMLVLAAKNDVVTPGDWAKEAFDTAREPKEFVWLPGGHFDAYTGPAFEISSGTSKRFFLDHLTGELAPSM
ncbi:alpha/beta hydrolase [Paenarthrobacter sp. CM16]|uniref:alpha/beta hydrolase n=1 Tax=Paenarthrobacter sp. CM16 TaxID=2738447 RepID=UPI001552F04A|nr:alpha/beta hydrolase [Paenarthrobacter sp. CM16]NQD88107.1 alpha/beta hydrolase [Paenarthrobacter sp. CM16]